MKGVSVVMRPQLISTRLCSSQAYGAFYRLSAHWFGLMAHCFTDLAHAHSSHQLPAAAGSRKPIALFLPVTTWLAHGRIPQGKRLTYFPQELSAAKYWAQTRVKIGLQQVAGNMTWNKCFCCTVSVGCINRQLIPTMFTFAPLSDAISMLCLELVLLPLQWC